MLYSFNIKLENQDYVDFNLHTLKVYDTFKKQVLSLRLLFAAVLLILSVMEIFKTEDLIANIIFSVIIFVFLALGELLIPKFLTSATRSQINSFIKKGKAPFSRSSQTDFYDDYFTEITESSKTEVKYSSIEKISFAEESKTIYLHFNKAAALIIPHTVFSTPEEMVEFLKFIKEKCSNAECFF